MAQIVYFCGLPESGKTFFLKIFFSYFCKKNKTPFLFKPFEKGIRQKNIDETETDAEIFSALQGQSNINLHNLYYYQKNGVLEYLGKEELNPFKTNIFQERTKLLAERYDLIFMELSGSLCEPVGMNFSLSDLIEKNAKIFWFFPVDPQSFYENYETVGTLLKFPNAQLILNNCESIRNQEWVFYLWNTLQEKIALPVTHMIPFVAENRFALFEKSFVFFEEAINSGSTL